MYIMYSLCTLQCTSLWQNSCLQKNFLNGRQARRRNRQLGQYCNFHFLLSWPADFLLITGLCDSTTNCHPAQIQPEKQNVQRKTKEGQMKWIGEMFDCVYGVERCEWSPPPLYLPPPPPTPHCNKSNDFLLYNSWLGCISIGWCGHASGPPLLCLPGLGTHTQAPPTPHPNHHQTIHRNQPWNHGNQQPNISSDNYHISSSQYTLVFWWKNRGIPVMPHIRNKKCSTTLFEIFTEFVIQS